MLPEYNRWVQYATGEVDETVGISKISSDAPPEIAKEYEAVKQEIIKANREGRALPKD